MRLLALSLPLTAFCACQCGDVRIGTVRPQVEAEPASLDFGVTAPGFRVEKTLSLRNPSPARLAVSELTLGGEAASQFSLEPNGAFELEAGGAANLKVSYLPTSEGSHSASRALLQGGGSLLRRLLQLPPQGGWDAVRRQQRLHRGGCVQGRKLPGDSQGVHHSSGPCQGGCTNDVCVPAPSCPDGCNSPPPCFKGGKCVSGSCQYEPAVGAGCSDGNDCTEGDACSPAGVCAGTPKRCAAPPVPSCLDAQTQQVYDAVGVCGGAGVCSYTSRTVTCALGCGSATGQCRSSCPSGQHLCSGQCVSDSSTQSCGGSCVPCPVPANAVATCSGGTCGFTCNSGYSRCGNACCSVSVAVSIAAGAWHTCAVAATGGVRCWGYNDFGQVGDGTSGTNRLTPVAASGLASGVTTIAAGDNHTCALTSAGGVKCWGNNFSGQIGDGTSGTDRLTPVNVIGFP